MRNVRGAFAELSAQLSTAVGRRRVEKRFSVCAAGVGGGAVTLDDPANRAELVSALSEMFPAQSNDPSCTLPACDIRAVCAVMNDDDKVKTTSSPSTATATTTAAAAAAVAISAAAPPPPTSPLLERLASLSSVAFGGQCVDVDHGAGLAALNVTSLPPDYKTGGGDFERSWFWQTCTEFGFYQTCVPGSDCPFLTDPPLLTLRSFTDVCRLVFDGMDVVGVVAPAVGVRDLTSPSFFFFFC